MNPNRRPCSTFRKSQALFLPVFAALLCPWDSASAQVVNFSPSSYYGTPLTAGDPMTLNIDSGTSTQGGVISGDRIVKTGAGTLILLANNTYTGGTSIQAGTLALNDTAAINHPTENFTIGEVTGKTGTLNLTDRSTVTNYDGVVGSVSGAIGIVNISSGTWDVRYRLRIGSNGRGFVNLSSGTITVADDIFLGESTTGSGTLNVNGGTVTNTAGTAYVGYSGTGVLNVRGGRVTNKDAIVGYTQAGTATVTGLSSSVWTITDSLEVGYSATGILNVEDGGRLSSYDSAIGTGSATGTVTVTGRYSTWSNLGDMTVGYISTGVLNVQDGGRVSGISNAYIGQGSNGTVNVTGINASGGISNWSADYLSVGIYGTGTLNILDGGWAYSSGTSLGNGENSSGTITVSGVNANGTRSTFLGSNGNLNVGGAGEGTFNVADGGLATMSYVTLSSSSGGSGTLNLSSSGAFEAYYVSEYNGSGEGKINFDGGILRARENNGNFIRNFEAGDITLLSGGGTIDSNGFAVTVNSPLGGVGGLTKVGTGTLTLAGENTYTGTTLVSAGTLALSASDRLSDLSALVANSGATFSLAASSSETVGSLAGAGTVTIADADFTVGTDNTSTLFTGQITGSNGTLTKSGTGTLTLKGQVTYTGNLSTLVATTINSGALEVADAAASLINDGDILVGGATGANSTLRVANGGSVSDRNGVMGANAETSGTATVTGINANGDASLWSNTTTTVGSSGTGTLNIQDGGKVTNTDAYLGRESGSTGTAVISGVNANSAVSSWANSGSLNVGSRGTGTLTVENGAKVTSLSTNVASLDAAGGTVNLNSNGVLETGSLSEGTGTGGGKVNFDGGTLRATANSNNFISNFESGDVTLLSGGGTIDSNGRNITISAPLAGDGGLTKIGNGTLTLSAANTYTGATHVAVGNLALSTSERLSDSSALIVDSGAGFRMPGYTETVGSISGTGLVILGSGHLIAGGNNTSTTFSGDITGTGRLTKAGTGTLTLSGGYIGIGSVNVTGGHLVMDGSTLGDVAVQAGGEFGGTATIGGTIGGAGSVGPGNSPGILTAGATDPTSGLDYNFEFTQAGVATWANAAASGNDVLHLTLALPFTAPLSASNEVNLYFSEADLTFVGGFFIDSTTDTLTDLLEGGTFNYYLLDNVNGTTIYNGNKYSSIAGQVIATRMKITDADFIDGNATGWTESFEVHTEVVPEPATWALLIGGVIVLIGLKRHATR